MRAFVDIFLYALLVPVLPFMLRDRIGLSDHQIQRTVSDLLAIYAAVSGIVSPIAGIVADKFASRRQLSFVCGLGLLLLATILLAFGQNVAVLAIAGLLQGASGGVVWTIGMAIGTCPAVTDGTCANSCANSCTNSVPSVLETVGQEDFGKPMGTMFSFTSVAGLFFPIMGGLLYAKSGYNGIFGLGLGLVAVDLILRLSMIEKADALGPALWDQQHGVQWGPDCGALERRRAEGEHRLWRHERFACMHVWADGSIVGNFCWEEGKQDWEK